MAPNFTIIKPSLPVSSIPEALEYYTSRLGFRLAGRDGDNHCWVQLVGDDSISRSDAAVNIYLRRRGFPDVVNDVQFGKVYIRLEGDDDELEKLRDTLKENKARIKGDIETKPWGLRDLTVVDPDGNIIIFNQMVKNFQMPANPNSAASSKGQDQN
ncbi:hypothetical protein KVR01_006211 [Diaporthe batatas]|uniref:uncharacterized protein n=1 Tax=Diaporthe batatas TaxID=748121 RepID=UPI001D040881|nr:uncharacterized protein KVR01_006211 [Diaporthe batatas]KAG8164293.1 hypothetical protein KVR01_006211 [Diaporthe batatas]